MQLVAARNKYKLENETEEEEQEKDTQELSNASEVIVPEVSGGAVNRNSLNMPPVVNGVPFPRHVSISHNNALAIDLNSH